MHRSALVDPAWLHRHRADPEVRLIEIAGMNQDQMQAYKAGHVPGAVCWKWKEMLWDSHRRDFPSPEDFARRCGEAGIGNDTTVVFYGEGVQFGFYAWWTFRYCGHTRVKMLDGARHRWAAEGRPLVTEEPPPAPPVSYQPVKRIERMRIHRDKVLRALGRNGTVILDGRSPEEYRGERVGGPDGPDIGALRYGRIPGAKHLYFEELLDGNKAFRPAAGAGAAPDGARCSTGGRHHHVLPHEPSCHGAVFRADRSCSATGRCGCTTARGRSGAISWACRWKDKDRNGGGGKKYG